MSDSLHEKVRNLVPEAEFERMIAFSAAISAAEKIGRSHFEPCTAELVAKYVAEITASVELIFRVSPCDSDYNSIVNFLICDAIPGASPLST